MFLPYLGVGLIGFVDDVADFGELVEELLELVHRGVLRNVLHRKDQAFSKVDHLLKMHFFQYANFKIYL